MIPCGDALTTYELLVSDDDPATYTLTQRRATAFAQRTASALARAPTIDEATRRLSGGARKRRWLEAVLEGMPPPEAPPPAAATFDFDEGPNGHAPASSANGALAAANGAGGAGGADASLDGFARALVRSHQHAVTHGLRPSDLRAALLPDRDHELTPSAAAASPSDAARGFDGQWVSWAVASHVAELPRRRRQ